MKQSLILVAVALLVVSVCNAAPEKIKATKSKVYISKMRTVEVDEFAGILKRISALEKRVKELELNE